MDRNEYRLPLAPYGANGSSSRIIVSSSPSYSAAGITPIVPSPARKMMIVTMRVQARLKAIALASARDIFWLLFWKRGPFPARQTPDVSVVTAITLQARAGKAARSRSGPFTG
ncbi:hypothetical protein SAMN05428936_107123 [Pelagibacterium halotolerans]|nr:hypothetical protein SAMN05428936_107123 [Pelagibacterium halotolerans]